MQRIIAIILLLLFGIGAVIYYLQYELTSDEPEDYLFNSRSLMQQNGTYYQPIELALKPSFTELQHAWFKGANSIWGATGRDDQGHIWFGVSGHDKTPPHLMEYNPVLDSFTDHGDPVSQLKALGISRNGEHQGKIHSRIIQMDDGWLYFASMDETDENPDANLLPLWGSHFWRYRPLDERWEHLFSAPEGLVAVSGVGRWVYALGYWGHVLYQYDTQTGLTNSVKVGSEGGHVSRNLVSDKNGHVYVPRMKYVDLNSRVDKEKNSVERLLSVSLIEYDPYLNIIQSKPLSHYAVEAKPGASHGITSLSYLADGEIVFGTHVGFLYKIAPSELGAAEVIELGWLHPEGESYNATLFPLDGYRYIAGITRRHRKGYQLYLYDLEQGKSQPIDVDIPDYNHLLLYGSNTRDENGRGYIVGRRDGVVPLIFQLNL